MNLPMILLQGNSGLLYGVTAKILKTFVDRTTVVYTYVDDLFNAVKDA